MTSPLSPEAVAQMVADPVIERTLSGETVNGIKVAAYMEDRVTEFGVFPSCSFHWSTPGVGAVNVQRLFAEADVIPLLTTLAAENATLQHDYDMATVTAAKFMADAVQRLETAERAKATLRAERDQARDWLEKANNEFGSQTWSWPNLWQRIAQLKELSNSRWQSLNDAATDVATLRASEADAIKAITGALAYIDKGHPGMARNILAKALTPAADKEPKT